MSLRPQSLEFVDRWIGNRRGAVDRWIGNRRGAVDRWIGDRRGAVDTWIGGGILSLFDLIVILV